MHQTSTSHFRLGLTGYPLSHSLSPNIHAAALAACGLQGEYSLFPVQPGDIQGLKELLARVRSGEIHGLNVTIPHKQPVIELLDTLTPAAQAIGAVNTIYMQANKLIGDNTDAPGFLQDLDRFLSKQARGHVNKNALILGAGGSARAVVYALLYDGWSVIIAARRLEQAQQLTSSITNYHLPNPFFQLSDLPSRISDPQSQHSNLSLIVNTTPVGMTPNTNHSPWPQDLPFPPRAAIYDLVYNPRETRLVADARIQGLSATTGLGMLIEQAALAFKIWTGHDPSREHMLASIDKSPISNNQ